ncbi:MAG: IS1096 element passenger TnpR family protein, partial [Bacteroidota bacterium]
MSVYRFKVIIEDYEDLFREIEVKASQSFEDLHFAILKAFGFDLKHPASFFYSDDLWHMEDEIAFKDMPYSLTSNGIPMISTKISQYIDDPHQRFIYIYQSNEDAWAFLLELVAVGAP